MNSTKLPKHKDNFSRSRIYNLGVPFKLATCLQYRNYKDIYKDFLLRTYINLFNRLFNLTIKKNLTINMIKFQFKLKQNYVTLKQLKSFLTHKETHYPKKKNFIRIMRKISKKKFISIFIPTSSNSCLDKTKLNTCCKKM